MICLLGARTVLSGVRPGVAISLSDSDFEFKEMYETARTFEDGVKKLQSVLNADEEFELGFEEEEESEEEAVGVEEEEESEEEAVEAEVEIKEEGEDNEEKFIEGKEEEDLD